MTHDATADTGSKTAVAIVGMACRFPGADGLASFWEALCAGRDMLHRDPARAEPGYQPVRGLVSEPEGFDAPLFGLPAREACYLNPQHRLFLETSHAALENAGCDPARFDGAISVYASCSQNRYHEQLLQIVRSPAERSLAYSSNYAEYAPSRVSYRLDLRGESMAVQTACSSSLVGIHLACQSLLSGSSDMALAGGVNVATAEEFGYRTQQGLHFSLSGHCRPFDARADGMVSSDGVGVIALKRLDDALADGDHIWAVIRGSAINNDGASKMSYTAPGIDGQAEAIALAQEIAGVDPQTLSYIEAHGTGTLLGDPIEVEALTRAFRLKTQATGISALGSVKANIGHTVHAAGVASTIKLALMMHHRKIPPAPDFKTPNPAIDFAKTPFRIPTTLEDWESPDFPLRGGISALGFGGTNAHAILEEAPQAPTRPRSDAPAILTVSAGTATALKRMLETLGSALAADPTLDIRDASRTLREGRREYAHRAAVVAANARDAARRFSTLAPAQTPTGPWTQPLFVFSGRAGQEPPEDLPLVAAFPAFREACAEARAALAAGTASDTADAFVLAHALLALWRDLGLSPGACVGTGPGRLFARHLFAASVGPAETRAARLKEAAAEIGSQPHAPSPQVRLVPLAAEAAVSEGVEILEPLGAALCLGRDRARAANRAMPQRPVTSFAAHCLSQDRPVIEIGPGGFLSDLLRIEATPATLPMVVSSLPSAASAADAQAHFLAAAARLWQAGASIRLEALPRPSQARLVPLPGYAYERKTYGLADLAANRTSKPAASRPAEPSEAQAKPRKQPDIADWFHLRRWRPARLPAPHDAILASGDAAPDARLVFVGDMPWQQALVDALRGTSTGRVIEVRPGSRFAQDGEDRFTVNPQESASLDGLFDALERDGVAWRDLIYLWCDSSAPDPALSASVLSPLTLTGALGRQKASHRLWFVTQGAQHLPGDPSIAAEAAPLSALARVIAQEHRTLQARTLDLDAGSAADPAQQAQTLEKILDELHDPGEDTEVAWRGRARFVPELVPARPKDADASATTHAPPWGGGGAHVIFGGTGHVGLALAGEIAREDPDARLYLASRSGAVRDAGVAALSALLSSGAHVSLHAADLADSQAVSQLLDKARTESETIDTVIHAAGVVDADHLKFIRDTPPELAADLLVPHVAGMRALADAVAKTPVGKVLLCSSLSCFVGGLSYGAHAAGHRHMDAVAARERLAGRSKAEWITVNYDTWHVPSRDKTIGAGGTDWAIEPSEGAAVLALAAAAGAGEHAISTVRLADRPGLSDTATPRHAPSVSSSQETDEKDVPSAPRGPSPSPATAQTPAAPAAGSLAGAVAACFAEVLGCDDLGLEDNFFELGGESLMMLDVIDLIRQRTGISVPTADAFKALTVADMTRLCEAQAEGMET
ncbi:SDR family NAD(P)-dependent oxidoreductase [Stappia sp. ES.058]|uniref:SDR family NAD(P)-dependent oxidoreductase n=1 Tax=Stappia sp. ES.058 TaxID=1881061 RepID=UPI00087A8438|nr:SDR family NAD(P)-dependent oxidoreductase [Stappia sp. ES.058]SDU46297.1 Acyl transferase domain-containing protein [Stappia sp. ES.058]